MSAVATPRRAEDTRPRTAHTFVDRLLAAVPLASIYLWLCIVYAFEAWRRVTPWLFTDELETTQISRAIAATGHPARRGVAYHHYTLYPYLLAPLWKIEDVATAYSAIKYFDVFVMTAVVFPTYFLARLVVPRGWALFAAAGAGVLPSLAYSSWIVAETIAYPYAALCFYLVAKALIVRSRGWIAGAAAASVFAPLVRGELIVIPVLFFLALLLLVWTSDWGRKRRAPWTIGDYVGFFLIVTGVIFSFSAVASHHSQAWYAVTRFWKHRIFVLGDWAAGALAIGLGVIPLVFGLAALVPVRGEERLRQVWIFRCVAAAGIFSFGLYTGMKAAYLSTVFATRVEERNLIYIAPLLFVGTALVLHRRRVNLLALAAAAAYGLYLVAGTPFQMDRQLYSDSLGFAILEQANRYYELGPRTAQWVLIGILALGVGWLAASTLLRLSGTAFTAVAATLAVGILAWNVTGEISASAGTVSISRTLQATLRHPFTWVDSVAHGKPTLYLGQGQVDQDPEWELEFWNRSIVTVDSLDGSIGGPGPSGAPNTAPDGRIYSGRNPNTSAFGFDYAVEDWPCIDFAGSLAGQHRYNGGADTLRVWRLIQLTKPNRLRAQCSGLYPDGWSGPNDSTYFRFVATQPGWLRIRISRQNWPPTPVHIQLARIATALREPTLGKLIRDRLLQVGRNGGRTVWIRTPGTRFGVRVVVQNKFVPRDVDPRLTDPRVLGAQVDYQFFKRLPPGVNPRTGG